MTEKGSGGQLYDASRVSRFKFAPDDVVILGLDTNDDEGPLYDASVHTPLDENMVQSVYRDGVIQDILVTPMMIDGERKPVVVDGRHRTRWARRANLLRRSAGLEPWPVHARNATDKEINLLAAKHTTNFVRANRDASQKVSAATELAAAGRTKEQIAIDLGCSISSVENFLALGRAEPEVAEAVAKGEIPVTAGYKLAKLPRGKQASAVTTAVTTARESGGKARVSDAIVAKKKAKGDKDANKRPSITKVRHLLEAAQEDSKIHRALSQCEPIDFLRWLLGDVTERVLPEQVRDVIRGKYRLEG